MQNQKYFPFWLYLKKNLKNQITKNALRNINEVIGAN